MIAQGMDGGRVEAAPFRSKLHQRSLSRDFPHWTRLQTSGATLDDTIGHHCRREVTTSSTFPSPSGGTTNTNHERRTQNLEPEP